MRETIWFGAFASSWAVALLALSVAIPIPANAATFLYSDAIENYVTPYSGMYSFTVAGAQGGYNGSIGGIGGGGAIISGDIIFSAGISLSILAGGGGFSTGGDGGSGGSGGGMSFIAEGTTPVIVAGGGGGAGWFLGTGGAGLVGVDGGGIGAGTAGQGGTAFQSGAGWFSDGATPLPPSTYYGTGGKSAFSFAGGAGYLGGDQNPGPGAHGGFGGGGGGGYNCGGGGGGFSGGGQLGTTNSCAGSGGGGGGSYITSDAFNVTATAGGNFEPIVYVGNNHIPFSGDANGYVSLDFVSFVAVPEPSTWMMLITGIFGVGSVMRRNRSTAATLKPNP